MVLLKVTAESEQFDGKRTGRIEYRAETLWPQDEPRARTALSVLGRGYTERDAVLDWNRRAAGDGHQVQGLERVTGSAQGQEPTTRTAGADTVPTPGEWVCVTGQFGPYIVAQSPGRDVILAKLHYSMTPDISEAEGRANRCLMTAAKEMLAALKACREVLSSDATLANNAATIAARNAINKAEGRA